MRVSFVALLALLCACAAYAWDKDDYEIFDLVAALQASEGKGTSFYSFLGVEPSSSTQEISRAYRKRSMELHPDKNPGVPDIQARFARLGVINQILRDPEKRTRYNFFYKNGVPTWKGFGYAYSRWRPGLGFVAIFLVGFTSLMQFVVQKMNHTKDTKRVEYFTESARKAARGASGRRRVRVPMVEGMQGGETLELVVDGEDVFLPHEDGTATPLHTLTAAPSVGSTWPVALVRTAVSRITGKRAADVEPEEDEIELESDSEQEQVASGAGASAKPHRGRAAELRAQRISGKREVTPNTAENTESEDAASPSGSGTEQQQRAKKTGGKAAGARRRKMAMKK